MSENDLFKGSILVEGKTKILYDYIGKDLNPNRYVYVENKDRITAFDGNRGHDLEGKAAISNATNAKVFEFLSLVGKLYRIKNKDDSFV